MIFHISKINSYLSPISFIFLHFWFFDFELKSFSHRLFCCCSCRIGFSSFILRLFIFAVISFCYLQFMFGLNIWIWVEPWTHLFKRKDANFVKTKRIRFELKLLCVCVCMATMKNFLLRNDIYTQRKRTIDVWEWASMNRQQIYWTWPNRIGLLLWPAESVCIFFYSQCVGVFQFTWSVGMLYGNF